MNPNQRNVEEDPKRRARSERMRKAKNISPKASARSMKQKSGLAMPPPPPPPPNFVEVDADQSSEILTVSNNKNKNQTTEVVAAVQTNRSASSSSGLTTTAAATNGGVLESKLRIANRSERRVRSAARVTAAATAGATTATTTPGVTAVPPTTTTTSVDDDTPAVVDPVEKHRGVSAPGAYQYSYEPTSSEMLMMMRESGNNNEDSTQEATDHDIEAGATALTQHSSTTSGGPQDVPLFEATLIDQNAEEREREQERQNVRMQTIKEIKSGIAVAEVVEDETEQRRKRLRLIAIMGILTVGSLIVAVVLGVLLSRETQDGRSRTEQVQDAVLREFGDDNIEAEPVDTAIEWMAANDTTLVFPIPDDDDEQRADFRQRFAMCVLAFATDVDHWNGGRTNWIKPVDECEWTGLNCDDQKRLIGINLALRGLNGTIPTEMGVLSDLRYVFFYDNPNLGGSLPSEMAYMSSLTSFYAQRNRLEGTLPVEWAALSRLENLDLSDNQLEGTIPKQFGGGMNELVHLDLSENKLTGPIPNAVWRLQRLSELRLDNNQLNSTIPTDLGSMIELEHLEIQNNKLTGQIPTHLASLDQLQTLRVQDNDLTGAVPDGICDLLQSHGGLEIFQVDCLDLECSCCTGCSSEEQGGDDTEEPIQN